MPVIRAGRLVGCNARAANQAGRIDHEPAPRINGVVETALYVDDLTGAVAFYREVLGLKPMVGDPARFQSFDVGRGQVFLLFERGATLEAMPTDDGIIPPHDGHGPLHYAFAISRDEPAAWRDRLEAHGVAIVSDTGWSRGGRSLYFHDPAGNLGELVTPGIWPNY